MKSDKAKQNDKEELRKAQTKVKAQKTLPMKLPPPNTLNANSPP
jgi:hypothetical protein